MNTKAFYKLLASIIGFVLMLWVLSAITTSDYQEAKALELWEEENTAAAIAHIKANKASQLTLKGE